MADKDAIYDLAVIGGGIAGAAVARDAALRGLSVCLFEKNSFGSGTSSKSSKLIHGGIRYLEIAWKAALHLNIAEAWKNFLFVFYSLNERRTLGRIAPDLVKPIPLIIPIYREDHRNPFLIYFGAFLYYFLALLSGGATPPRIFWNRKTLLKELPSLKPDGLMGGVMIWDSLTDDVLLVRKTIESAVRAGALCLDQSEVTSYRKRTEDGLFDVVVKTPSGTASYSSHALVDATGPWVDKTRALASEKAEPWIVPVAGSHIELRRFIDKSIIIQAEDGRVFFVISRDKGCRVGTTERLCDNPDEVTATEEEINYLLRSVSRYFPNESFSRSDILLVDAGIRPLSSSGRAKNHNQISRDHEIKLSPSGALHLVGVKLTDHRRAAQKVVDRLIPQFLSLNRQLKRRSETKFLSL